MFDGITDPMLHPDRYETYILVEPHTGASLSGHARMQVHSIMFDPLDNNAVK